MKTTQAALRLFLFILIFQTTEQSVEVSDFDKDLGLFEASDFVNVLQWEVTTLGDLEEKLEQPFPDEGKELGLAVVEWLADLPGAAYMNTKRSYRFPNGGSVSVRYWVRSTVNGTNGIQLYYMQGAEFNWIISLYDYSTTDNNEFRTATANIPNGIEDPVTIWVYGPKYNNTRLDVVAIDSLNITIND